MKLQGRYCIYGFTFLMIGIAFILSSCATIEQQPMPYVSPVQEILYSKSLGLKEPASPTDNEPLGNTRWHIINIRPRVENLFKGTEFFFERSGILVESAELPNNTIYTDTHRYRVLGSTLVLTKNGHTSVALFKIERDTLTIEVDNYTLTLDKVK